MRSLTFKLLLALGLLVIVVSLFHVALSIRTTQYHLEESLQRANRDLAANIAKETRLFDGASIDELALEGLFHSLMVINPSIELYLLDMQGKILAYSAPPGDVRLTRVAMDPIRRFLAPAPPLPIWGDDPRTPDTERVFSVAPMVQDGTVMGYLYVVMGGTAKRTLGGLLETSHILRLSLILSAVGVVLALLAGGLVVGWLTRHLRHLADEMRKFRPGTEIAISDHPTQGDEIAQLRANFAALALRVRDQIEEIRAFDRERRNLVAAISHDLRTPLTALQVVLDTLDMKDATLTPDKRQELQQLAGRQSQRLRRLVDDLFELAKLESPDFKAHLEPAPLAELIQDVTLKLHPLAEAKSIELTVNLGDSHVLVPCDMGLMERALENLIRNAINFTPTSGRVIVDVGRDRDWLITRVRDTGPGIAPEHQALIFNRFQRGEQTEETDRTGSGLGLAIAQRILGLHDSAITVDSTPGHGATFSFALRLATRNREPVRA